MFPWTCWILKCSKIFHFKQNTDQLYMRTVGFVLKQYWLYLLLAFNCLYWKILNFSAQKYFHSIKLPFHLLQECAHGVPTGNRTAEDLPKSHFRYSLHWALRFHDINSADRLYPLKSFNNVLYAASDKYQ